MIIMKLVILIPAYNEEEKIASVISQIPKKIFGVEKIEILVIDDGSTDKTVEIARNAGANKVISHRNNLGVGAAFMTGIRNAISMNADIVVTVDADSQFNTDQIQELIVPILNKQVDVVTGSRFLKGRVNGIPRIKFFGNKIFTKIVSKVIGQKLTDTQSGFRAYSKDAILNLNVINDFTYTQEVLIDLKFKGFKIGEIPVSVVYDNNRKSRVVKNIFDYSYKAVSIIIKTIIFHRPIFTFGLLGIVLLVLGGIAKTIVILGLGWVSSTLSSGLIILGFVSIMLGLFANVIFKRQSFIERSLKDYLDNKNKD